MKALNNAESEKNSRPSVLVLHRFTLQLEMMGDAVRRLSREETPGAQFLGL